MTIGHSQAQAIATAYTAAWTKSGPEAVARFFAEDGVSILNRAEPLQGREAIAAMAAEFYADIPDLTVTCNAVRVSGDHVVCLWTFSGTHVETRTSVSVAGWEEWDLDPSGLIKLSRGWYDEADYAAQTAMK